ncbi:MAG: hypothetical protein ACREUW_05215 [Burkholderiales bacterium]
MQDYGTRRQRAYVFFALLAVAGTVLRWLAPRDSELALFGAMLLVLWIPVTSYAIFYLVKKRPFFGTGSRGRAKDEGFRAELLADVTFAWPSRNDGRHPVPGREYPCIFALGAEGFSACFVVPAGAPNAPDAAQRVQVEFLVPATALPRFPPGTRFKVLEGAHYRGEGRVVDLVR